MLEGLRLPPGLVALLWLCPFISFHDALTQSLLLAVLLLPRQAAVVQGHGAVAAPERVVVDEVVPPCPQRYCWHSWKNATPDACDIVAAYRRRAARRG